MMKRRILTGLLAVCLSLSLALPGFAAGAIPTAGEVTQVVTALGILDGSSSGELELSRAITRAEFITMAVKASPNGDQVGEASTSPYPDVPYTHWAAGYVEAAVAAGLVSAYSDGTFRPDNPITLAEGATVALGLLGYTAQDYSGAYPTPQLALYRSRGLDKGVSAQRATDSLTRQDAMYLFYNLLTAQTKEGSVYVSQLGYSLNAAGELDLVALINGEMEGPLVATGSWQSSIPFSLTGAAVYRNGAVSNLGAIQENDVVYWNQAMNTLWVSSDKVIGVIQALEPSASNPTSVQVLGRTYDIESAQAALALSDLGQYGVGDTVTLLLGRSGGVAAVAGPSAVRNELCGVVTRTERSTYDDGHGGTYTADMVTILATDGNTYQYQWTANYLEVGDPVGVSFAADGTVTLRRLSASGLSGTVSQDGTKVGETPFADGAEILDVTGEQAVKIFPSRLAGMNLTRENITYYSLNPSGEIDRMILNDATGDADQYGLLTRMETMGEGLNKYYSYTYDVGGVQYSLPAIQTHFPVVSGGIRLVGDPADPERMYSLTKVEADGISGNQLRAGSRRYTIGEQVVVYEYRDNQYFLSTLDRVQELGLDLTGWYDRPEREGGRIRIIVGREA